MTRVERIAKLRGEGKSWEQVGAALGCTAEAARCAYKKHNQAPQEKCEDTEDSTGGRSLQYFGKRIRTVEELLDHTNVDTAIWEVIEQKVNTWEVAGKNPDGDSGLWKTGLLQISVRLKRRAPKPIQDGIRELLKNVKPIAVKAPKRIKATREQMLEVGLYDHHFGKLCWAQETGSSYDLKIAQQEFQAAIDEMIARVQGEKIEKIIFPLGNDFFHANDWQSNTANGTRVESTDDRFSKVFRVGCQSVQYAIERCLQVAPTDVLWVPGNHDRHTSWFLTEWIAAVFRGNKHLSVNNRAGNRKYVQYGINLLGYTHGDELKPDKLPLIMAQEMAQAWAETKFRSWRTGHLHKRMETRFIAGDTHQGVEHRIFPSLCGTDAWHYSNGFCGNAKMAECHLWDKQLGPVGYHIIHGGSKA